MASNGNFKGLCIVWKIRFWLAVTWRGVFGWSELKFLIRASFQDSSGIKSLPTISLSILLSRASLSNGLIVSGNEAFHSPLAARRGFWMKCQAGGDRKTLERGKEEHLTTVVSSKEATLGLVWNLKWPNKGLWVTRWCSGSHCCLTVPWFKSFSGGGLTTYNASKWVQLHFDLHSPQVLL